MNIAFWRVMAAGCMGLLLTGAGLANEAAIRKNIAERVPNFPVIDEITKTAVPGLCELRVGTDVFYADANGDHLFRGHIIDTRTRANLTEERVAKLTAIDFAALPLKDAVMWRQGSGARKIAVFADPNCGYCKKFEQELQQIKDITVYTFLYPILGPDSHEKSRNIWCAKDSSSAWLDWMLRAKNPGPSMGGKCDTTALQRDVALGQRHKVNGTPSIVFEDGKVVPGAMGRAQLEKQLSVSQAKP
jgi:thiol:disulfide interchange protein DsbC